MQVREVSSQGYLRIPQIIGQRAISEVEASENRRRAQECADELSQIEQIKCGEPGRFAQDQKLRARYRDLRAVSSRPRRARPAIPALIPISESSWWAGIKSGRYPPGIKLGAATVWRAADILALVHRG
jgi:prophage regulatory protein